MPHCKDRKIAWLYVSTITIDLLSDLQHKKIKARAYLVMTMWILIFRFHFGANQTAQGLRELSFPEAVLWRLPNSKQYGRAPDWPAQVDYGDILLYPMFIGQEWEKLPFKKPNDFLSSFRTIFTDLSDKDITNFTRKPHARGLAGIPGESRRYSSRRFLGLCPK